MPRPDQLIARRTALKGVALASIGMGAGLTTACTPSRLTPATSALAQEENWVAAENMEGMPLPPSPIEATQKMVEVDNGEMWLMDTEQGSAPVLLLHAFTGSARSWGYQIPALSNAGYRVIAPSARGAYGTTAPLDVLDRQVSDMIAVLDHLAVLDRQVSDMIAVLDHLAIGRAHLVGTAYGGMVALRFALAHSDRVHSLTLSCTLGGVGEQAYSVRQRALMQPEFMALPAAIKELGPSYRHSNPAGVKRWTELTAESADAALKALPDEDRQRIISSVVTGGPGFASLAGLSVPVNLIYGGADLYAPPSAARMLHSQFANSRLTIIQETGHSAYWEQPEVFNRAVLDFIDPRL